MIASNVRARTWIAVLTLVFVWSPGLSGTAQPTSEAPAVWPNDPFEQHLLPPDVNAYRNAGTNLPDVTRRVETLTNEERTAQGHTALTILPRLNRIACRHNKDMLAHSYSGHEDSDGRRVGDRLTREHRTLLVTGYGENVFQAWGKATQDRDLASTTVDSWMKSPPHRKNILRRSYTHLGVCVTKADDQLRATQVFATVAGRLATPLPWAPSTKDSLTITVQAASDLQFRRYAFPRVDQREAFEFDQTVSFQGVLRVPSAPGRYELRMAHVDAEGDGRTFHYSFGPRIDATAR